MASELAKINLDISREANALAWEAEWHRLHVSVRDRLKRVNGKYVIAPCPHCEELDRERHASGK